MSQRRTDIYTNNSDPVTSSEVFILFNNATVAEKREVAKNIIDTYVRDRLHSGHFKYTVQQNLSYDFDADSVADSLMNGVDAVDIYSQNDMFGVVNVDLIASTLDHGTIEQVPGQPQHSTAPGFESSTFVKCSLKTFCRFSSTGPVFDIAVSVSQHPIHRPDEE